MTNPTYAVEFISRKGETTGQTITERYADLAECVSAAAIMQAQGRTDARPVISLGSAQVYVHRNAGAYLSIMTCNRGQTALKSQSHDTIRGADRWAVRVLSRHAA